ncbi:MAG: hypothetical protein ACM35G_15595, partial [Planctomycetaceae bacterium]
GYLFALLVLVAVRPLALSLLRSPLGRRERAAAAWFGPKGFASVVFGLLILKEAKAAKLDWARADQLFHLVALCIAGSIIAHSSTDVLVARWLGRGRNRADHGEALDAAPAPGRSGSGEDANGKAEKSLGKNETAGPIRHRI